jgi:arylformamidase
MTREPSKRTIIDISFRLGETLTVWPGDTPVSVTHIQEVGETSRSTVSKLVLSSHAGTHMDAPSHFIADGRHIDAVDLSVLIGPCTVVHTDADAVTDTVLRQLSIPEGARRLLIKTQNGRRFSGTEPFFTDYVGVTTSGANWLVSHGVRLLGIDYLSAAAYDDIQAVHHILLRNEVVLLETLDLREVEPGDYHLVALPLKLKETDGSPVRAVLYRDEYLVKATLSGQVGPQR